MQARIHWEWPRMQRYIQTLTFVHIKLRGVPMKERSDESEVDLNITTMNLHTNTFDLVLMRLKRKAND